MLVRRYITAACSKFARNKQILSGSTCHGTTYISCDSFFLGYALHKIVYFLVTKRISQIVVTTEKIWPWESKFCRCSPEKENDFMVHILFCTTTSHTIMKFVKVTIMRTTLTAKLAKSLLQLFPSSIVLLMIENINSMYSMALTTHIGGTVRLTSWGTRRFEQNVTVFWRPSCCREIACPSLSNSVIYSSSWTITNNLICEYYKHFKRCVSCWLPWTDICRVVR